MTELPEGAPVTGERWRHKEGSATIIVNSVVDIEGPHVVFGSGYGLVKIDLPQFMKSFTRAEE